MNPNQWLDVSEADFDLLLASLSGPQGSSGQALIDPSSHHPNHNLLNGFPLGPLPHSSSTAILPTHPLLRDPLSSLPLAVPPLPLDPSGSIGIQQPPSTTHSPSPVSSTAPSTTTTTQKPKRKATATRMYQNRIAQKNYREKKESHVRALETRVSECTRLHSHLLARITALEAENQALRNGGSPAPSQSPHSSPSQPPPLPRSSHSPRSRTIASPPSKEGKWDLSALDRVSDFQRLVKGKQMLKSIRSLETKEGQGLVDELCDSFVDLKVHADETEAVAVGVVEDLIDAEATQEFLRMCKGMFDAKVKVLEVLQLIEYIRRKNNYIRYNLIWWLLQQQERKDSGEDKL